MSSDSAEVLPHDHHDDDAYVVQLLLSAPFSLDADRLEAKFAAWEPCAVLTDEEAPGVITLVHADGEGETTLSVVAGLAHPEDVLLAVQQTWDWPQAEAAAARAKATLVVSDTSTRERGPRLARLQALVQLLLHVGDVEAVHWMPSQRLVEPAAFLESVNHGGSPGDAALNVRLVRVVDGRPDEMVMDTLGLAPFGLPDLQLHFVGLDPGEVARLLFAYAEFLFEKGDVIGDDSLIRGLQSWEEWPCFRTQALLAPHREVLDLRPEKVSVAH